jgi:hypothetical protein
MRRGQIETIKGDAFHELGQEHQCTNAYIGSQYSIRGFYFDQDVSLTVLMHYQLHRVKSRIEEACFL